MPPGEPLTPGTGDAPPRTEDSDVLRRTAAGDLSAFEILMDRHGAAVRRFVRGLTDNDAACEEALQETFRGAWRGAAGFRGDGSARSWLLSIARNAMNRQFRRRSGEPEDFEPVTVLGARAGWGEESAEFLPPLEDRERVEIGLRDLSPSDREVLEKLSDYLDGELVDADVARIDNHLAECNWCERFGGRFAAAIAGLRMHLQDAAPLAPIVRKRLLESLRTEAARPSVGD